MAAAIAKGELSPVDLIDWRLDRIERLNPSLNAFVTVQADQARAVLSELLGIWRTL